jgi:hypothetical protein
VALGARRSKPLKVASGPKGSWTPSSPMRRCAESGRHTWWKVERGLNSLSMPSLTPPSLHNHHHATALGALWGLKVRLAGSLRSL